MSIVYKLNNLGFVSLQEVSQTERNVLYKIEGNLEARVLLPKNRLFLWFNPDYQIRLDRSVNVRKINKGVYDLLQNNASVVRRLAFLTLNPDSLILFENIVTQRAFLSYEERKTSGGFFSQLRRQATLAIKDIQETAKWSLIGTDKFFQETLYGTVDGFAILGPLQVVLSGAQEGTQVLVIARMGKQAQRFDPVRLMNEEGSLDQRVVLRNTKESMIVLEVWNSQNSQTCLGVGKLRIDTMLRSKNIDTMVPIGRQGETGILRIVGEFVRDDCFQVTQPRI